MNSIKKILLQAGLHESEADIYLWLIKKGTQGIPAIAHATGLSRVTIRQAIERLRTFGLVETKKSGKEWNYSPTHPQSLQLLAQQKQQEANLLQKELEHSIAALTGSFNLTVGKPGVQFFEGVDGLKTVLYDSLNTTEMIYAFVNMDIANEYVKKMNEEYRKLRIQLGIAKQIIMPSSPNIQQFASRITDEYTQVRFIDSNRYPFHLAIEIYGDNVSYLTMHKGKYISCLLTHPEIAQFHKNQFRFMWDALENLSNA